MCRVWQDQPLQRGLQRHKKKNGPELRTGTWLTPEDHIDTLNINSINFNSKHSAATANIKTLSNQVWIIVPYKVDTGSDWNIMPFNIFQILFPRATKEQLVTRGNKNTQKTYSRTTLTQLSICKVKLKHNNKHKTCNLFVVPGNGQALLGMSDIETLDILNINCYTIDTQEADRAGKCSTMQPIPRFKEWTTLHKHDAGSSQTLKNAIET